MIRVARPLDGMPPIRQPRPWLAIVLLILVAFGAGIVVGVLL